MRARQSLPIALLGSSLILCSACVPKTQYEDQQARLEEAQKKLKSMEFNTTECDPDMFLQLREQAQSLDLLNQELLERNTELAKDVAELKASQSESTSQQTTCDVQKHALERDHQVQMERLRKTYEDLITELRKEIQTLKGRISNSKKTSSKGKK